MTVTIFTDVEPERPDHRRARGVVGWSLLVVAVVGATVIALLPAPYVIERPGPVFDTLSAVTVKGEEVPLISIPSEETFPTEGALNMLTVSLEGNRDNLPNWARVATAWFDPSMAVVPVDLVFPAGVTVEQSAEQSRVDMANSQQEAIAAALSELDYSFTSTLTIAGTTPNSPAAGVLLEGDLLVSVNGEKFADVSALREAIARNGVDKPLTVVVSRDGAEQSFELTPVLSDTKEPVPVLGIFVGSDYDFPFEVKIQLDNVGGPSAGMMFALGIIDKLTPGPLTGGKDVAGTGTISADGTVGPIGGIRQKMWGALGAGADWFLAPSANCGEVVGHIPDGLRVFSVDTLDDALTALTAISSGTGLDALPTCTAG